MRVIVPLAVTAIVGCGSDESRIVDVGLEAAGDNCPAGGTRLDTGVDGNGDGSLSGDEIDATEFICREGTLTVTTPESPGANCAAGGFRLDSGIDADGNGTLDASEVMSSSYVCNMGETLVSISDEPFGDNCVRGGLKIETGVDANADGVLDPSEVGQTAYQCQLYVVQVAAGFEHTCWLLNDGMVRCAGDNAHGQLGRGDQIDSLVPVLVPGLADVAQIAAGGDTSCALLDNGTVRCWGENEAGQVGDKNGPTDAHEVAAPIANLTGVNQIAVGDGVGASGFSCAVLNDGTVKCWGDGVLGKLGNGNTLDSSTPVRVFGLTNATQVSLGYHHACALLASGSVECWGQGIEGQLGNDDVANSSTPVTVSGGLAFTKISAGGYHTCALDWTAKAHCWGNDSDLQLGDDAAVTDTSLADSPQAVDFGGLPLTYIADIDVGAYHTCALTTDGRVRCWGRDTSGQVGDGGTNSDADQATGYVIPSFADGVDLELGTYHTCVVTDDGRSMCWGNNGYGECGLGFAGDQYSPAYVSFGAGAVL